jgi:hypothetical protein
MAVLSEGERGIAAWGYSSGRGAVLFINVRGSFRILSFTPWSAKDLERKVDSAIPGKLFGGETVNRSETMDFRNTTSVLTHEFPVSSSSSLYRSSAYFRISKSENFNRKSPSTLMDKSPHTKNPPSVLSTSFSRCRDETKVPVNAVDGGMEAGASSWAS